MESDKIRRLEKRMTELEQIIAKRQIYIVKTDKIKRDLDAVNKIINADGTLADATIKINLLKDELIKTSQVLATLISDLKTQRILSGS